MIIIYNTKIWANGPRAILKCLLFSSARANKANYDIVQYVFGVYHKLHYPGRYVYCRPIYCNQRFFRVFVSSGRRVVSSLMANSLCMDHLRATCNVCMLYKVTMPGLFYLPLYYVTPLALVPVNVSRPWDFRLIQSLHSWRQDHSYTHYSVTEGITHWTCSVWINSFNNV